MNMKRFWLLAISLITIWGLLIWGNVSLIEFGNSLYDTNMHGNYLVNSYKGRMLLDQDEYTDFKKLLLNNDIKIDQLDVYSSTENLVIYDITAPEYITIPHVGEPESRVWRYSRSRASEYAFLTGVALVSLIVGVFAIVFLTLWAVSPKIKERKDESK